MAGQNDFKVRGLPEFSRSLREVSRDFPEANRLGSRRAVNLLERYAKARASARGGVFAKAAQSFRTGFMGQSASLTAGGPGYPFFKGAEFGAKRYRQFDAWRGNRWDGWDSNIGYFLHPSIRGHARELMKAYADEVEFLTSTAFPE